MYQAMKIFINRLSPVSVSRVSKILPLAESAVSPPKSKSYTVWLFCLFIICINPLLGFTSFWLSYQLYGITSLMALLVLVISRLGYYQASRWGVLISFWAIVTAMSLTAPESYNNYSIFLAGIGLSLLVFDKRETLFLGAGIGISLLLWLLFMVNPFVVPLFPEEDYYHAAFAVNILCTLLAVVICLYYLISIYEKSLGKLHALVHTLQEKEEVIGQRNKALEQAVHELRLSRDELLENQDFLTTIIDNLPVMLFVKDADRLTFTRINKAGEKLLNLTESQLVGKTEADFLAPGQAGELISLDREIMQSGNAVASDEAILIGSQNKTLRLKKVPIYSREGKPLYLLGIAEDITEQKKIQDQMQASLYEKEILLSEIHHRVKNNMAIISSLLALQANQLTDPVSKALFMESCKRIKSMALIHEKLYQSHTLAYIEYKSYVSDLVNNIKHSYNQSETSIFIDLEGVMPVHMDIVMAVPCGLILNELISNAYKHAFKGKEKGTICVTFDKVMDDAYNLTVSDDGIGMDPDMDIENSATLGMILIDALVSQLKGKLTISNKGGTTISIHFKEAQKKAVRKQQQLA
jgi:PAS domain S-box-containing protein